jgi:hypothetical protein
MRAVNEVNDAPLLRVKARDGVVVDEYSDAITAESTSIPFPNVTISDDAASSGAATTLTLIVYAHRGVFTPAATDLVRCAVTPFLVAPCTLCNAM